ncbi:MAG: endonuclease III [Phycisphaeraceae bacterium]
MVPAPPTTPSTRRRSSHVTPTAGGSAIAEDQQARAKRAQRVYRKLLKTYPDAHCELKHANAYQLLIATILSAQCTDVRVNMVTPVLFERYPTPRDLADAEPADVEEIVRSTGFFRSKAKSIISASRDIADTFAGEVPATMEDLLTLRGVARKTANVVLGNAFGINEGVVVDTHVKRITHRLGFTNHTDPKKVEKDLAELFPRKNWTMLAHLLIFHGRRTCYARKPDCQNCPLAPDCPSARLPG